MIGGRFLTINMKDKAVLYSCYMPFIANGGLFIATPKSFSLGDELALLLTLPDESDKMPVSGKVIWVTPKGAQNNRPAGIGLQFDEQGSLVRDRIETLLAGQIGSEKPTYTL